MSAPERGSPMSAPERIFPRYRFVIAILSFLLAFHNGLTAAIPALFMGEMGTQFGVEAGAMGLYMGLITVVPIIAFAWASPIGYKIGFKTCAGLYLVLKLITLCGAAFASDYLTVSLLKLLEGGAAIFLSLSILPILRTWFSRKSYGKLSSWVFGIPTSLGVMTYFFLTPIIFPSDWRGAHLLYGAVAGFLFVAWAVLGRGPLVEPSERERARAESYFHSLKTRLPTVLRIREVPLMACWLMLGMGLGRAMTSWMPSFLQIEWYWSVPLAAALMNVQNIVNIISSPIAGALSDKIGLRRPFIVIAGAMNALSIFMSVYFVGPAIWFWYAAFGFYTSLDGFTLNAILMEHPSIGYRLFPYAMSIITLCGTIGGLTMPTLLGVILESTGSLSSGLILVAFLNLFVVAIGLLVRETGWKASGTTMKKPDSSVGVRK